MLRLVLLGSMLSGAPALGGEEDCTLSTEVLRPQLDTTRLPKGASVTSQSREGRFHRETVRLPDGLVATLAIGGCAHLAFSVSLTSPRRVTPALTPMNAIALMKRVLAALPVDPRATLRPRTFLDALGRLKAAPTAFPVQLDCGQEFTTCELSLDVSGKQPTLVIGYDFAL